MRLIDSEELKRRVNNSKYYGTERQRDFCDMIAESETIDAVEVVRCKDCRHAEHREQMPNQVYCKRDKLSTFCAVRDDDDFCKYGEREKE